MSLAFTSKEVISDRGKTIFEVERGRWKPDCCGLKWKKVVVSVFLIDCGLEERPRGAGW